MSRKRDDEKFFKAEKYFLIGESKKSICDIVGTTTKTLNSWIIDGNWEAKKSAGQISRTEIANKALQTINTVLDTMSADKEVAKNFAAYADQLAKLSKTIAQIDKSSNVSNDMDVFIGFNQWAQNRAAVDRALTIEIVKAINFWQDKYITEKLSRK